MAQFHSTRRPLGAVFVLSMLICGAISLWGVLAPDALAGAANALTGFALTTLDWVFLTLCTSFVVLGGVLAFGPYDRIKLDANDDEPECSTRSWIEPFELSIGPLLGFSNTYSVPARPGSRAAAAPSRLSALADSGQALRMGMTDEFRERPVDGFEPLTRR